MLSGAVLGLKEDTVAEIAFFGGSFTAIDRRVMEELLQVASGFVDGEKVTGIRLSTRPDAIDMSVLSVLKRYGVTAIELGAQSMDDKVLSLNRRGHTSEDVEGASRLIREHGFSLGLQMMTGLYGATQESDYETAEKILALSPDTVRIYPTLTLKGTYLEELYQQGVYVPPTIEQTVSLCAKLLCLFESAGIAVIKLGLHAGVEKNAVAGPFHPALRELCESELFFQKAKQRLPLKKGEYELRVHPKCLSKMLGQKRNNIHRFAQLGYAVTVKADSSVLMGDVKLK